MPKTYDDVLKMPLDELQKRVEKALTLFAQLEELFPGLLELTDDARRHSVGKYRDGEAESLGSLLDVAAKKPVLFETLADQDEGDDPTKFEPTLVRDRLERAILLGKLLKAAEEFVAPVSDTRLHLANLTRPVLLAMYELTKPHAKRDPAVASLAKAAIDFYGAISRASAATRAKNKAGKKNDK
ncbi:MAG: hypothetical protein QM820_55580 [Minicystis sp.]